MKTPYIYTHTRMPQGKPCTQLLSNRIHDKVCTDLQTQCSVPLNRTAPFKSNWSYLEINQTGNIQLKLVVPGDQLKGKYSTQTGRTWRSNKKKNIQLKLVVPGDQLREIFSSNWSYLEIN